jgi:hypothetical protein
VPTNLLDMSAAIYNPIIQQNATWEITLTILTPSLDGGITPGPPFNLTDYTGQSQIKASYSDSTVLASPTVTIVDAVNGVLKISVSLTQAAALSVTSKAVPPKPALPVWDAVIANSDQSKVFKICKGEITVEPGVTHWTA